MDGLPELLTGYVERGAVPGVVALVDRGGEVWSGAYGALAHGGPPLPADALFRITSMTKPLVGAATLTLVDRGDLRLADPVDDLLPELAGRRVLRRPDGPLTDTVPARRPITVGDLLRFTTGLGLVLAPTPLGREIARLGLGQGPPSPDGVPAPDEWLRRLGTLPLQHQPGDRWLYHTSADILGVLLARACGTSLLDALRRQLLGPLGMTDTAFHVPPGQLHRFVTGYRPDGSVLDAPDGQWSHPPEFESGGHGLVSTAADYAKFARMLRSGGDGLLRPESIRAMTTNQLTDEQRSRSGLHPGQFDGTGWGLCLSVELDTGRYGWDGGYGTWWTTDPRHDLTGLLLTQCAWASLGEQPIHRDFWAAITR